MENFNKKNRYLGEGLIFIISAPRSGSTLLQRMLASHSMVFTHPEPHILTPLAFQGVYYEVDKAAFNHRVAAQALREYVEELPNGEEDYLDACREYCRVLYMRIMEGTGKHYFIDKTPNYADTILPFLEKIFPNAKYIVLTRHPLAILSSNANTFFNGDYNLANYSRDILGDFIPPISKFLENKQLSILHVQYENVVQDPENVTSDILKFLGLNYEKQCVDFGGQKHITKTYGDPKIHLHTRPVTSSISNWVKDMNNNSGIYELCRSILRNIPDENLDIFGYPKKELWNEYLLVKDKKVNSLRHCIYRIKWNTIWCIKDFSKSTVMKKLIEKTAHLCSVLLR